jgi:hypothetical protein
MVASMEWIVAGPVIGKNAPWYICIKLVDVQLMALGDSPDGVLVSTIILIFRRDTR